MNPSALVSRLGWRAAFLVILLGAAIAAIGVAPLVIGRTTAPASKTPSTQPTSKPVPTPTLTSKASPSPSSAPSQGSGSIWHPAPRTTWGWQLTGTLNLSENTQAYDIDIYQDGNGSINTAAVQQLHSHGTKAICYVDVGTWESYRKDSGAYPDSIKGSPMAPPFGDERWVDIRQEALKPILQKRFDDCKAGGFDGIEFDNVDGYRNNTGISGYGGGQGADAQLTFNRWLADQAHQRGLAAALKNDLDQASQLVGNFDFAIVEQCFEFKECEKSHPFIDAYKAVLEAEYNLSPSQFCSQANLMGISAIKKNIQLDASFQNCWG